jgi:hypothetical protein
MIKCCIDSVRPFRISGTVGFVAAMSAKIDIVNFIPITSSSMILYYDVFKSSGYQLMDVAVLFRKSGDS